MHKATFAAGCFWGVEDVDPTTLNRQGPDVGTQYRSAVFFHTSEQEVTARVSKAQLQRGGRYKRPIVTAITPAMQFYPAEAYHQQFFERHGLFH